MTDPAPRVGSPWPSGSHPAALAESLISINSSLSSTCYESGNSSSNPHTWQQREATVHPSICWFATTRDNLQQSDFSEFWRITKPWQQVKKCTSFKSTQLPKVGRPNWISGTEEKAEKNVTKQEKQTKKMLQRILQSKAKQINSKKREDIPFIFLNPALRLYQSHQKTLQKWKLQRYPSWTWLKMP